MRAADPVCAARPDWWMACTADGFGSHVSTIAGVAGFKGARIHLVKEESQSSHVVQPFDRDVAANDKKWQRRFLDLVRETRAMGSIVNQHALVLIGLQVVRESKPEHWQTSFIKCNLHPKFRIPLDGWLFTIRHFIEAGSKFEAGPTQSVQEQLPRWYGEMSEENQQQMHGIFREAGADWDRSVVTKLAALGLTTKQMGQAGMCHLAIERTKSAAAAAEAEAKAATGADGTGSSAQTDAQSPDEVPQSIDLTNTATANATALPTASISAFNPTRGLHAYTLKPGGMKGEELFAHMCRMRKRTKPDHVSVRTRLLNRESRTLQSLNLEIRDEQMGLVEGDMLDRGLGALLQTASSDFKLRMPKRTLNMLGEDRASCCLVTDDKRVARLRSVAQLADGINNYKEIVAKEKETKAAAAGVKKAERQAKLDEQAGVRAVIRPVLAALDDPIQVSDTKMLTKKILESYCKAAVPPIKMIGSKALSSTKAAAVVAHFVALHPTPAVP